MSLPLIAEVLAGETLISPGGPLDTVTACGWEPFLWERWLHDAALEAADASAAAGPEQAGEREAVSEQALRR